VSADVISRVLTQAWDLAGPDLEYVPEGGGAYHWRAGRTWFVTLDDLDTKPWLGSDRDTVFAGLAAAYGAAVWLREAGLDFVVAPIRTRAGATAERIDERYSVSVFPYVAGTPGRWGESFATDEVVGLLAQLHAMPAGTSPLPRRGMEVPGHEHLDEAPGVVADWLAELDDLAHELGPAEDSALVVTHGEPHPGNVIRSRHGLVLIDWDTVALARPERDLWMLDAEGTVDPVAARAYRLLWALSDVAAFTARLRAVPDDEWALAGLRSILDGSEPAPYGSR
jgi:spectinomycin phosphotransferase